MDLWVGIAILVIFYILYNKDEIESFITTRKICNDLDGRCYQTVNKFKNQKKASELLAELNKFNITFLKHLRNKYIWNYHPNKHARDIVEFLISNYNPDGIIENAPVNDVNTSYVDNKGVVFAICLREKLTGNNHFHDLHDLEFVVLHELSHMATISYGHDKEFWTHFKFLLTEAKEAGLHMPKNYKHDPINYCSLRVDYSPYFDNELADISNEYIPNLDDSVNTIQPDICFN